MTAAERWRVRREGDSTYVSAVEPLGAYPPHLGDRLRHWAEAAPERTFLAERDATGEWARVSYAEAWAKARAIGSALVARGVSAERPLAILSGNSVAHALMGLGCLAAGVPWCPISPAYSQSKGDLAKLRGVLELLTPGLVFVDDVDAYARALDLLAEETAVLAVETRARPGAETFADLLLTPPSVEGDAAYAAIGPDTIAKFLLTSGSTGAPKAVINTQRMLCSNQQMVRQTLPGVADRPPVIVDWLPWNHTYGGNKVFNLVLYNGGTLYIDHGRPTPPGFDETLKNLREISSTIYFNVPVGLEMLATRLEHDLELRHTLFKDLDFMYYAGAGLSLDTITRLEDFAQATTGRDIFMFSGLGATETSPYSLWLSREMKPHSDVGLPAPGLDLKLTPVEEKTEARVRGPNVTPGYWRAPALTASAFDDEGFYRLGDALRFVDPAEPQRGLKFDGRIAEDFKLSNGTWVSAGRLRVGLLEALKPFAADVVIAGLNQPDVRALVFPDIAACRALAPGVADADLPRDRRLHDAIAQRLTAFGVGQGASGRVAGVLLLSKPPSLDAGELTDKGSISQRGVLAVRADAVQRLYARTPPGDVIFAAEPVLVTAT